MKRSELAMIAVLAAILSGCATQGMKSTPFYEGKDGFIEYLPYLFDGKTRQ